MNSYRNAAAKAMEDWRKRLGGKIFDYHEKIAIFN
jgi:hypothetical protein